MLPSSVRSPPSPVSGDVAVDYEDKKSAYDFYRPQKGKGKKMIPVTTLNFLVTATEYREAFLLTKMENLHHKSSNCMQYSETIHNCEE